MVPVTLVDIKGTFIVDACQENKTYSFVITEPKLGNDKLNET